MEQKKKNNKVTVALFFVISFGFPILMLAIFGIWIAVNVSTRNNYYKGSNWNCESQEVFEEKYMPYYEEILSSLLNANGVEYRLEKNKVKEYDTLDYYMTDSFVRFSFKNEGTVCKFKADYYLFSNDSSTLREYSYLSEMDNVITSFIANNCYDYPATEHAIKDVITTSLDADYSIYRYDQTLGDLGIQWMVYSFGSDEAKKYDSSVNKRPYIEIYVYTLLLGVNLD